MKVASRITDPMIQCFVLYANIDERNNATGIIFLLLVVETGRGLDAPVHVCRPCARGPRSLRSAPRRRSVPEH